MEASAILKYLTLGENVCVEFKRGGNGFEDDTLQTVCSFLNRFGGDIFLGITDTGEICGVPEKAAPDMVKNFIKRIGDTNLFSPTVLLVPEILQYEEKTIIHVHIPPSAEVHKFKKDIYDRVGDSDVKVTATGAITQMYIRKQNIYTEKKIYPYVKLEDLRTDLLPRLRKMALNKADQPVHPWMELNDEEMLRYAGLYATDRITGETGYNLAAVLLLGRDEVIRDVVPAYTTDALLRRVNVDRYDDREIVETNLIESYEKLLEFAQKHMLDKFYLEDGQRLSLRYIIARELVSNILMHREYTSPHHARLVIESNKMYTVNASRATQEILITPANLEPVSKNPIIAKFFREIGFADTMGSGVRKLFKYTKQYSGADPVFEEGDIFRITVPLDDSYSYDANIGSLASENADKAIKNADKAKASADKVNSNADIGIESADKNTSSILAKQEKTIKQYVSEYGSITTKIAVDILSVKERRARFILSAMVNKGILVKQGQNKGTIYIMA